MRSSTQQTQKVIKMKRTISKMLGITALAIAGIAGSFIAATPAQAVPTCTPYFSGTQYPSGSPNSYMAVCVPNVVAARRDEIFNAVTQLPKKSNVANPNLVRDHLQQAEVVYFYFADRAAANDYFLHTNGIMHEDTTARCGSTRASTSTLRITVAIYDKCTLTGNVQMTNPNLRRTTLHETGHAFALALGKNAGNIANGPDRSTGWKLLFSNGVNKLTPPQWTSPWNQGNRDNYLCVTVFQNTPPSALELDLGATSNPVCSGNPIVPIDGNGQKTPRQITEEKLPYFVGNSGGSSAFPVNNTNLDLWAQLFVIRHDSTAPTQTGFLKLTDQVLGKGSWIDSTANFQCAKVAMQYYYTTGAPPTISQLTSRMCPGVTF
jgi:hypothetical protein